MRNVRVCARFEGVLRVNGAGAPGRPSLPRHGYSRWCFSRERPRTSARRVLGRAPWRLICPHRERRQETAPSRMPPSTISGGRRHDSSGSGARSSSGACSVPHWLDQPGSCTRVIICSASRLAQVPITGRLLMRIEWASQHASGCVLVCGVMRIVIALRHGELTG